MIAGAHLVSAQPALPVVLFLVTVTAVTAPTSSAALSVASAITSPVVVSTAPDLGGTLLVRFLGGRGDDSHPRAARRFAIPAPDPATRFEPPIEPRRGRSDHRGRPLATLTVDARRAGHQTPKSTPPACTDDEARDSPGRAEPADVVLSGPRMPPRKIRGWIYRPHPGPSDQHRARRRRGRHLEGGDCASASLCDEWVRSRYSGGSGLANESLVHKPSKSAVEFFKIESPKNGSSQPERQNKKAARAPGAPGTHASTAARVTFDHER